MNKLDDIKNNLLNELRNPKPAFSLTSIEEKNPPPQEEKKETTQTELQELPELSLEHQIMMVSLMVSYVGVHGTQEEKLDLLKCLSFIYNFASYDKYFKKIITILMNHDENASVFNVFQEIPDIDDERFEAEMRKIQEEPFIKKEHTNE